MYRAVKVNRGSSGWGGPLVLKPTEQRHIVLNVTGGHISEVATRIAELTGAEVVDGFKTGCPDDQVMVAVVDCGGTARCGVYPSKGIFTINLLPSGATGPLAKFIKEDIYVSGVKEENIELYEGEVSEAPAAAKQQSAPKAQTSSASSEPAPKQGFLTRLGKGMGGVISTFYQAGRDSVDSVIRNILPFMAFVSLIMGIITKSGAGNILANTLSPFASTLFGLLGISIFCALPFLSPVLGPGAVIAQIVGVIVGSQIGLGNIPPQYALPALFAIDPQVGCDFIPVGLSLGEAEAETIEIGVPAILFSRLITGPIAVVIAYFCSFGLFS